MYKFNKMLNGMLEAVRLFPSDCSITTLGQMLPAFCLIIADESCIFNAYDISSMRSYKIYVVFEISVPAI